MFSSSDPSAKTKSSIVFDWRVVSAVLLVALTVCIFLWKPWASSSATTRKITITGEATVKGTPDEYQLSPYFEFTGDAAKAKIDAAALATTTSAKLKELGVKDSEISSNTSSYDKYLYTSSSNSTEPNLTLTYTITVVSKETAQKVQDYFLTTAAKGQLSPQATFSQAKRKELEAQARQNAIDDAKEKAGKSADQVGAKVGKVVSISDGGGMISPIALSAEGGSARDVASTSASIPIQSGQNDFTTTVEVVYELR